MKIVLRGILLYVFICCIQINAHASDMVYHIHIDGGIGSATNDYVAKGIKSANKMQAKLVVLTIDTPGGLDVAMRGIVQSILVSEVPVAGFVYPKGARAASAGAYILYASHIAAMAPGTNVGAATPVNMLSAEEEGSLSKKAKNDSIAYMRSLAELRQRDIIFAEKSVSNAESVSAEVAQKRKIIDFIADDIISVVKKSNGKIVDVNGKKTKISIKNPVIKKQELDFKTRFLLIISDPSIVYMLFIAGIYCLFFEFNYPGLILPGVLGGLALVLSLYGMNFLPINYVGLALLVLGVMFIVAEFYIASLGVLGVGGVIAMVAGSIFLYDSSSPAFHLTYSLVGAVAFLNILILCIIIYLAVKSHKRSLLVGDMVLYDKTGIAATDISADGKVAINGEIWNAKSENTIKKGSKIRVINVDNLLLTVIEDN